MDFLGISLKKQHQLQKWMSQLQILEQDLQESFVLAQGKGGQNVNKVATCVYLVHVLTGVQVKCQKTRSQGLNRYWARVYLLEKIEARRKAQEQQKIAKIEKIKRQNRKRPAFLKEKILEFKHRHSEKKKFRSTAKIDFDY